MLRIIFFELVYRTRIAQPLEMNKIRFFIQITVIFREKLTRGYLFIRIFTS